MCVDKLSREERVKIAKGAFGMWKDRQDFDDTIAGLIIPSDDWQPDALAEILILQQDEDGGYIVSEEKTIVYGHGETSLEALRDYIVSTIEYVQLLLPKTVKAGAE